MIFFTMILLQNIILKCSLKIKAAKEQLIKDKKTKKIEYLSKEKKKEGL